MDSREPYHALPGPGKSLLPTPRWHSAVRVGLAISMSFGAHASKEALAPAESALSALGVTPLGYAVLTVSPIALGFISPLFWGRLYDSRPRIACCLAPAGELLGASLLAFGLRLHSTDLGGPFATLLLCLGFLSISACKAGVSIAEFSTVGCASGAYSAFGFSAMVLAKHAFVMVMDWSVPKVLATTHDAMLGLFRVQFFLLAPHAISVAAGLALSRLQPEAVPPHAGRLGSPRRPSTELGPVLRRAISGDERGPVCVILLIGLWRSLAVGTLHLYHSIRIKFMESRGMDLPEAGAYVAASDGVGIVVAPLLAALCRFTGLKPMIALVPVVAGGGISLLHRLNADFPPVDVDHSSVRLGVLLLSAMEVFVPILPLALLPANAGQLGSAYGAVEIIFIAVQMAEHFALGLVRVRYGYRGAFWLILGGFAAVLLASVPVLLYSRENKRPWQPTRCVSQAG